MASSKQGKQPQCNFLAQAKDMVSEKTFDFCFPEKGHIVVFGITGSGKTESLLLPVWDMSGIITVIDGKGDEEAKKAARILKPEANIFTIDSEFNILEGLKKEEIVELFKNAFYPQLVSTQESFYQYVALTAIQFVVNFLDEITFEKIFISLFRENIKKIYDVNHASLTEAEDLIFKGIISNSDYASYISNLMNKLQPFALKKNLNVSGKNFKLNESNWFSLRNIDFENTLGRMIIEYSRLKKPYQRDFEMTLCIDEFSDLMYSYFSKIIKEIRGFNIQVMLLTQSFADINRTDENLLDIILNNTTTKIFFAQDGLWNEKISQLFGYEIKEMKSRSFMATGGETVVSAGQVKDYLVQPSSISELQTGKAIGKIKVNGAVKRVILSFNHIDTKKVIESV